ncbi:MAG TPA: hypothetical protein VHB72_01005 [Candidatus Saccharimonadales bacterium]|nr:hypothetical protein [Candidatus Saccharimonadales bacterium]
MNEQLPAPSHEDYDTRMNERTQQFVDAIEEAIGRLSPDMPVYQADDLNRGMLKGLDASHALPGTGVWGDSYSEYGVTEEDLSKLSFDEHAVSRAAARVKDKNIGSGPGRYDISLTPGLPEGPEAKKSAHRAYRLGNGTALIVFRVAQLPGSPSEGTVTHHEVNIVPFDDYKERFDHEKFIRERDRTPAVEAQPPLSSDDY